MLILSTLAKEDIQYQFVKSNDNGMWKYCLPSTASIPSWVSQQRYEAGVSISYKNCHISIVCNFVLLCAGRGRDAGKNVKTIIVVFLN